MAKIIKTPGKTKTDAHKKAMLEALEKTLGIVAQAAKVVGICRMQHYTWMQDDPEYRKAVESISDIALDFAESQLHKQIASGEVSSTIFYLKTKGKRRGYVERIEQEMDVSDKIASIKIEIVPSNSTNDQK